MTEQENANSSDAADRFRRLINAPEDEETTSLSDKQPVDKLLADKLLAYKLPVDQPPSAESAQTSEEWDLPTQVHNQPRPDHTAETALPGNEEQPSRLELNQPDLDEEDTAPIRISKPIKPPAPFGGKPKQEDETRAACRLKCARLNPKQIHKLPKFRRLLIATIAQPLVHRCVRMRESACEHASATANGSICGE